MRDDFFTTLSSVFGRNSETLRHTKETIITKITAKKFSYSLPHIHIFSKAGSIRDTSC